MIRRGYGLGESTHTNKSAEQSADKSRDIFSTKSKGVHIKFSDSDTEQ